MKRLLAPLAALLLGQPLLAQAANDPPAWRQPAEPFRIIGNIFYVGSQGLAAYLIATPDGAILIDGTVEDNVPMIERNIDKLGYRLKDVKILLNSHAHFDHAEGLSHLKRDTHAQMVAVWAETPALESGIPPSELSYGVIKFPPVKVDRVIRTGRKVRIGNTVLKALVTPGHTPGCTSWTTTVIDGGKPVDVIFLCSLTVAGNKLIDNKGYPGIIDDFYTSFARLNRTKADVVLPFHAEQVDLMAREKKAETVGTSAYVDPTLLPKLVAKARTDFEAELAKAEGKGR